MLLIEIFTLLEVIIFEQIIFQGHKFFVAFQAPINRKEIGKKRNSERGGGERERLFALNIVASLFSQKADLLTFLISYNSFHLIWLFLF